MALKTLPVVPRTTRPTIAGMPVWYAEASQARTTLDISITIPSGNSRKLVVLWGSDGGEFPTAVTFDPTGGAFALTPIEGAFGEIGNLRVAAYYLDAPPAGARSVRITTANAVWSVASLKVYQNARAGALQAVADAGTQASISLPLDEGILLDAYSESTDLALATALSAGDLTPFDGQTAGAADEVNGSFLATTSGRTHPHNGSVLHGWSADAQADLLQTVVNILFSTGQIAAATAAPLSSWNFDDTGIVFLDEHGRSNAGVTSGNALTGVDPLLDDDGASISVQGTTISAQNHVDWQVASWSLEVYCQARSWPVSGNKSIISKDSGLPVPGGWQLEVETTGAIDWYIRNEVGIAGTSIHVTGNSGDGELTLDEAFVIHLTYNDDTKTARIYLNKSLLAEKTDPNFAGMQNNASSLSFGHRGGTAGVEFDGLIDQVTLFTGALTPSEVSARPDATTVSDPGAPGGITMQDIHLGVLAPSTVTDIDPANFATGLGSGNRGLTEIGDAANRMSFLNDGTPTAQIRITTPSAPSQTTNESATATIAEAGGAPSNVFTISWQRQGQAAGGGYTPFPFVTLRKPTDNHTGCASRPPYSGSNPENAAFIDPMSGLQVFRVTPNRGASVLINNTTDTGLDFPANLKGDNNPHVQRVWNADNTLLMFNDSKSRSSDPANPCKMALIDVKGIYGNSGPWRFLRAWGASRDPGVTVNNWFWDPLNPLRAYIAKTDGMYEWFPAGAPGETVGAQHFLFGWNTLGGTIDSHSLDSHTAKISWDGQWFHMPCRRVSDGRWGGQRINLQTGAANGFFVHPEPTEALGGAKRGPMGTGPLGINTIFSHVDFGNPKVHQVCNLITGARGLKWDGDRQIGGHPEMFTRDGQEYLFGTNTSGSTTWSGVRFSDNVIVDFADDFNLSVEHVSCRAFKDSWELVGGGTASTGLRYALVICSSPAARSGIMGLRLDHGDMNQWRYICHHRTVRTDNANECHPQPATDFSYVMFPSNWCRPGVESDTSHVNNYVVKIPDAWRSPNNNGS